jgi:hypothetical protein
VAGLVAVGAPAVPALVEVLSERAPAPPGAPYVEARDAAGPAGGGMVAITPGWRLGPLPRFRAAQALGQIGSAAAAAVPSLVEVLSDPSEPSELRAATRRQRAPVFVVDVSRAPRRRILLLSPTLRPEPDRRHADALRRISRSVQLLPQ